MNTSSRPELHAGRAIADILTGAWRAAPPAPGIRAERLERLAPLLVESGAAALAWNRIAQDAELRAAPAAASLQEAYRFLALDEARKEAALGFIAGLFADAGLEPLLFKGWAAARHYARPHLRPLGDFDLCAPPGRHDDATELLRRHTVPGLENRRYGITQERGQFVLDCADGAPCQVDLHADLDKFQLASFETVHARAQRIPLGKHAIRVPSAEDHLRLVAVHFLIHGGYRPLWLCDVAAMLEGASEDFRWEVCFGDDPQIGRWLACTFELAHRLLDARIDHVPPAHRVDTVPLWFEHTVLNEWCRGPSARIPRPFSLALAEPWTLAAELKRRWPNPIQAAVALGRELRHVRPWRAQLAAFGIRLAGGIARELRHARSAQARRAPATAANGAVRP
jgi:hypothetical protein